LPFFYDPRLNTPSNFLTISGETSEESNNFLKFVSSTRSSAYKV
jgi:hypothetical protein